MVDLSYLMGLVFADMGICTHCVLYNQAYFVDLIFAVRSSTNTVKIGSLENFPLYGMLYKE